MTSSMTEPCEEAEVGRRPPGEGGLGDALVVTGGETRRGGRRPFVVPGVPWGDGVWGMVSGNVTGDPCQPSSRRAPTGCRPDRRVVSKRASGKPLDGIVWNAPPSAGEVPPEAKPREANGGQLPAESKPTAIRPEVRGGSRRSENATPFILFLRPSL